MYSIYSLVFLFLCCLSQIDPLDQPVKTLGVMDVHLPPQVFQLVAQLYRNSEQIRTAGHPQVQAVSPGSKGALLQSAKRMPDTLRSSTQHTDFCESQDWSEDGSGIRLLPNGSMFVSRRIRRGIFPQVLSDILQTRIMVKQAMKKYKGGISRFGIITQGSVQEG